MPESSSSPPPPSRPPSPYDITAYQCRSELTKHPQFYIDDCMATFQVEQTLIKIHRFFLSRESSIFDTMFRLPIDEKEAAKPIILPDVTVAEFEALLKFLYDGLYETPKDSEILFWSNLLSVSTRFFFDKVRERAIRALSNSATPVDKLYLARRYDISQWVQDARKQLCVRSGPLEIWEAERIGWETAVLLAKAREILRDKSQQEPAEPRPSRWSTSSSPRTVSPGSIVASRSPSPSPEYRDYRVAWAVNQAFGETEMD